MADETRALAKFAADIHYDHLPDHVRKLALDSLVDQHGREIGCCYLPWARQVREMVCGAGGLPEATVVGYGDCLPVAAAAFSNSTFDHSFEYAAAAPFFQGHPGAEFIPPLISL